MIIDEQLKTRVLSHTSQDPSSESCGLIISEAGHATYVPCRNSSDFPSETFEISAEDWMAAEDRGEVLAVVHSHINGEQWLTGPDRLHQHLSKLPWVLVVDSKAKVFPYIRLLRGRPFNYKTDNCCTLISDAYQLCGLDKIEVYNTDNMEEDTSKQLLLEHLPKAGFKQVDKLQPGDVILTMFNREVTHASLYIGQGEVLHHAYNQLSRREPYSKTMQRNTHSFWRHSEWKPHMLQAIKNDLENIL